MTPGTVDIKNCNKMECKTFYPQWNGGCPLTAVLAIWKLLWYERNKHTLEHNLERHGLPTDLNIFRELYIINPDFL